MDENAANYDENATVELLGDCIYMASMELSSRLPWKKKCIEDILEESPKSRLFIDFKQHEWFQSRNGYGDGCTS